MHLVRVSQRQPARHPALAEIRDAVLAEWRDRRRREAKEQAYRRLRERYEIVVEPRVRGGQRDGAVAAAPAAPLPEAARGGP